MELVVCGHDVRGVADLLGPRPFGTVTVTRAPRLFTAFASTGGDGLTR